MTPKEKSKDLINSFYYALPNNGSETGLNSTTIRYKEAIQCALICVDEILKFINTDAFSYTNQEYWQKVKQEIEKL